jgi:DNA-binding beta-propeller fold protein YncE
MSRRCTPALPATSRGLARLLPRCLIALAVLSLAGCDGCRAPLLLARWASGAIEFVRTASAGACDAPTAEPIVHVDLPGKPFASIATPDGCWIFVSVLGKARSARGIAVLRRAGGDVELVRIVPVVDRVHGMVLTHDGTKLVVASQSRVGSGEGDPLLGYLPRRRRGRANNAHLALTADDRFLFVSEEAAKSIAVVDVERALRNGFRRRAIVGRVPVGRFPVALAFSPDGRHLFATSQIARAGLGWPKRCHARKGDRGAKPEGALVVIDVARATVEPDQAVLATVPAGCAAVRMAASPDGATTYVTARISNELLAFDTKRLVEDPDNARLGGMVVGREPVGVAVAAEGAAVIVASSQRTGIRSEFSTLAVVDAAKLVAGDPDAVVRTIPAGGFPRELALTRDRRTLLVTNAGTRTLELVDLTALRLGPRS